MKIIIPSYKRSHDMRTLKALPKDIKFNVDLLVRPEEYKNYEQFVGECNVCTLPEHVTDYGKTIHHILTSYSGKICILDDDLDFMWRPDESDYHLKPMPNEIKYLMFEEVNNALSDYAHVSVSAREGNNRTAKSIDTNVRYMRFLAYNLDMFEGIDIEIYKSMITLTDFDLNLQLLRKGRPSLVFFKYAQGQKSSNAPGGCSVQRTMDVQAECAELLHSRHKDFVKVVTKTTKVAWGGQTRKDVHVGWKRAFASAKVL